MTNQADSKSLAEEADGVAQKIADLTTVKCKDGYYTDRASRPKAAQTVKATNEDATLTDQQHFPGYQWNGVAIVGSAGYPIYKRGGTWYYHPSSDNNAGFREADVPVDLLQSIKPACPTAG